MSTDVNGDGVDDKTHKPINASGGGLDLNDLAKTLGVNAPAAQQPGGVSSSGKSPTALWWENPYSVLKHDTSTINGVQNSVTGSGTVVGSMTDKGHVASFFTLPADVQSDLNHIAKIYHPLATGKSFYETMVSDAAKLYDKGTKISPLRLAYTWGAQASADGSSGSGSGSGSYGSSAYNGPVTKSNYSVTDATSAHVLLNNMASDLLGRNLTDQELNKYTQQFNAAEKATPSVTTRTPNGHNYTDVTTTAPTKEVLAKQILQSTDEAVDHTLDKKVVDMFLNDIKSRQAVANG